MALILYRVMRSRLRASDTKISPERALEKRKRLAVSNQYATARRLHCFFLCG
jgi:hypothetical protein